MQRLGFALITTLLLSCSSEGAVSYDTKLLARLGHQQRQVRALSANSPRQFPCLAGLDGLKGIPSSVVTANLGEPVSVGEIPANDGRPHLLVWTYGLGRYETPAPLPDPHSLNEIVLSNGPDFPELLFFFGDDLHADHVICGGFPH